MTATIEQMPGGQVSGAFKVLVSYLRDSKKPAQQVTLLTPIAVTKDNLNQGERLSEVNSHRSSAGGVVRSSMSSKHSAGGHSVCCIR